MSAPASTVVVVPREAFSPTPDTLVRLVARTPEPRRIVVVDGGSPSRIRRRLESLARAHDMTLIRRDAPLTGSEARNLALSHVDTEFVAYVDNDTLVPDRWLPGLEEAARATGAAVTIPVVVWGPTGHDQVHFAGGTCHLEGGPGQRRLVTTNTRMGQPVETVAGLRREPSELVEFHCFLVRTDVLRRLGPFDESLIGAREEADFALLLTGIGQSAWITPDVVVDYPHPKNLRAVDRAFFRARWGDEWATRAFRAFNEKWTLDDVTIDDRFLHGHIDRRLGPYPAHVGGWRGRAARIGWKARRAVDLVRTPLATRAADRRRAAAPPARVVCRASWDRDTPLVGRPPTT